MKLDLLRSVFWFTVLLLSSYCCSQTNPQLTDENIASKIIEQVSSSSEFESYKSARGLQNGGQVLLIETTLKKELDKKEGTNYLLGFTYQFPDKSLCHIFIPIEVDRIKVMKIHAGSSDGGCGD